MTVTVDQTRSTTTRLPVLVACLSLLYGALGLAWLLGADWYPFGLVPPENEKLSLLAFLPEHVGAGVIAVLGFLGVPAALGHTRTEWSPTAYRPLLGFTALQVVVFGLAVLELATGLFDWGAFKELGEGLAGVPEKVGSRLLLVFGAFLLGAGWAVLGIRGLRTLRGRGS
ncbi:hypothetical protein EV644_106216 [Kribbella orskensis]|uniref:Uncharacterized protein n=1 Tax=Kribbella orskensis TaxID=2512216 RepID=A0ABY2BKB2_9ACTN|nr:MULTISPECIES: hypothetical protein [Kribbella]TCN40288.1 hypothetical protein EV642_105216 [Kribbella sp. VKM Ac-2500]TCO22908.1 hypothetical protein EV644_106216 [Kribbella orskensis]